MPRDGSNIYTKPAGTTAVANTTIESAKFNLIIDDLVTDANTARPVVAGGTGASTAGAALTNLGAQPVDATLTSIAALGTASDRFAYTTGVDTWAEATITAAGRALLDDADAAAQRTTLGLGNIVTTDLIDEDDMASNTDAQAPTQQSVKAYVDSSLVFSASYTSSDQTITAAGSRTLAHGLGAAPSLVQCRLKCVSAEGGYSVNDEVLFSLSAEFDKGLSCVIGATNIEIRYGSNSGLCELPNKSTGAAFRITNSNWRLIVKAWA